MSYSIMYNWQFLKSEEGLTPVVLMGDNNVTTRAWMGNHWGERRARDWGCLFNLIGITEEEFMKAILSLTGRAHQEHWKCNGKWVDDKKLLNWAKSACKMAASVEDVIQKNPCLSIRCELVVWNKEDKRSVMIDRYIHTTEELDRWIKEAKAQGDELHSEGCSVYPIIRYDDENIKRCANKSGKKPDTVLIKGKYGYVVHYTEDIHSIRWSKNIKDALVMNYSTAEAFLAAAARNWCNTNMRMINATARSEPYNAIIRATQKSGYGCYYVSRCGSHNTYFVADAISAKRYPNMKAAKKAAQRMTGRSAKYNYEAVLIQPLEAKS